MAKVFTITEGLENLGALSTGGQGSVYKVRRGEEISAVKILPTPLHSEDENDKNYRDFQNEVSKLKKVNEEHNPYVVKILSSGITDSGALPFIEMEFIEGPDLANLIQPPHGKIFTISETIKFAEQISNALAHCHKVAVKHGDIKSNNVKLNLKTDNYMLLDFGLSIMTEEQRRTSLRHAGAIEFMAPEQNEGELLLQSDIYSFGIILFELLAGTVPFPLNNNGETSRNEVMISHMEKAAPDILELRKQNLPVNWDQKKRDAQMLVPNWLLAIVAKCLEKRPENRFGSGTDLHEAIVNSISSKDIFSYKPQGAAILATSGAGLVNSSSAALENTEENVLTNQGPAALPTSRRKLKPVLIGVGVILALLILFGGYSALNNPEKELIDTTATNLDNQRLQDSISNSEKLDTPLVQKPNDNPYINRAPGKSRGKGNGKGKGHSKGKGHKNK